MNLNEYQKKAKRTAGRVNIKSDWVYPVLGLVGEAGEVADKVKKIFRDKNGKISSEDKDALISELGDVLWYLSEIASQLDVKLEDVAKANIEKLASRKKRGKLMGSGDNR